MGSSVLSPFLLATLPDYMQVCQERTHQNAPSLFVPEPKRCIIRQACRSRKRWRFFSLYGCEKNTTSCSIAWTGYVWLATLNQAMGGLPACFCSDPIPPVAVATDQPAKHVLSRSAGEMASFRQPSFIHNGQLAIDLAPVVDLHRPLFCSFKC